MRRERAQIPPCTPLSHRVGEQLGALGPQRVMEAAAEEPEGEGQDGGPQEPRRVVGKQLLVVMRHGQRIDEVRCSTMNLDPPKVSL